MTVLNEQSEIVGASSISTVNYKGYEFTVDDNEPGVVNIAKADRVYVGEQLVWVRPMNDAELEVLRGYLFTYLKGPRGKVTGNICCVNMQVPHDLPIKELATLLAARIRAFGNPRLNLQTMGYAHEFTARYSDHRFSFEVLPVSQNKPLEI